MIFAGEEKRRKKFFCYEKFSSVIDDMPVALILALPFIFNQIPPQFFIPQIDETDKEFNFSFNVSALANSRTKWKQINKLEFMLWYPLFIRFVYFVPEPYFIMGISALLKLHKTSHHSPILLSKLNWGTNGSTLNPML